MRDFFGLTSSEVISKPFPRIVTRKDLSLDNYFADLLLRASYKKENRCPDFEEIVIRGSEEDIPVSLNPQIKGAVLIGIGGKMLKKSKHKDFITAYDEHDEEGTRSVDSASQVVFFRHLDKFKKIKTGVSGILPVLNEINLVDSKGEAPENHLIQIVKDLHLSKFYRPGFIVEEYPPQWKRAIVDAILVAVCLKNKELKHIDLNTAGERLREIWKKYREQRKTAVADGLLMPISENPADSEVIFNKALSRTASAIQVPQKPKDRRFWKQYEQQLRSIENEREFLFTLRKILFALEDVWGEDTAYFVIAFLLEAKLQLGAEFHRISTMPLDEFETFVPEAQCSLIYYVTSEKDMKPNRGITYQLRGKGKKGVVVLKDLHRYTMTIFSCQLDTEKWADFTDWLQKKEPNRWYIPYDEEKGLAPFILNGTRYYLGSEPSSLTKEDLIDGLKETFI